jgi:hypothetical protein
MSARPDDLRRVMVRTALPPLLLAAAYLAGVRLPLAGDLARTREQVERLRSQAPTEASAALQRRQLDELTAQVEAARAAHESPAMEAAAVVQRSALQRAKLREELTAWMARHELVLLAEEHGPQSIEPGQQAVLGVSVSAGTLPSWRLEFLGAYLDVLEAMRALAGLDADVIPLRLEMRRSTRGLEWTLVLA